MRNKDRFWSKVNKTETCWLWTVGCFSNGYGCWERHKFAHRVSYQDFYGVVLTSADHLHHKCHNVKCVRPDHLEKTNYHDHIDSPSGINARKTHCKNGHEFTTENTYLKFDVKRLSTTRNCRICSRAYVNQRRKQCREQQAQKQNQLQSL